MQEASALSLIDVCLSVSFFLVVGLSVCMSVCLSVCNVCLEGWLSDELGSH